MVGALAEIFANSQVGILVDYRGLTVAEVTELRRRLHETATGMRVLKNRLAKIAIKDTPFEPLAENLVDTRALIYGDDPVAPAKVVSEFQEESKTFSVLRGLLVNKAVGSVLDTAQIKALGALPSRDELVAQLFSVFNAPVGNFVRTINEVPAKLVRTLAALAEARGGG